MMLPSCALKFPPKLDLRNRRRISGFFNMSRTARATTEIEKMAKKFSRELKKLEKEEKRQRDQEEAEYQASILLLGH